MSQREALRVETLEIPAAHLGAPSSLPDVGTRLAAPYTTPGLEAPGAPDRTYGQVPNLFPYLAQDGYGRVLEPRAFRAVILENRYLRATVLPELGGRVWSLRDRVNGVDLLYENRAIQLGNLALRNAWFAGGIEYNIGTRGHSPLTCSPLHTATVVGADGEPSIRMWEFDRLREVVFQIDLWLPTDSPVLLAHIRIVNPNDRPVPMYWWTNAAVPQTPDARVLCPASTALTTDYTGGLSRVRMNSPGARLTEPATVERAVDYFFETAPGADTYWILNADARGNGLALISTAPLRGRKLFCWGTGTSGENWQRWLSPFGGRYCEIQAGLATTQYEHVEMPSRSDWSWIEAYGNAGLTASGAQGADWDNAVGLAGERVDTLWPPTLREAQTLELRRRALAPPETDLVAGSGWGALERRRRRTNGQAWIDETPTPFGDDTLSDEQLAWRALLDGAPIEQPPDVPPTSYVRGTDWERRIESTRPTWLSDLHLAVMAHARGEPGRAEQLYRRSIGRAANAWAWRGLARLAADAGRTTESVNLYRQAVELSDDDRLVEEACLQFLEAGRGDLVLQLTEDRDQPVPRAARLRLLRCRALAAAGETSEARRLLEADFELPDLQEGETTLSDVWGEIFPDRPVPAAYDFRIA